jgi:hypothetical protein
MTIAIALDRMSPLRHLRLASLAFTAALGCAGANGEAPDDHLEDISVTSEPLSAATDVAIDEGNSSCQSAYVKFTKVTGATHYQLYRDTYVVRNMRAADVSVGLGDWSITPSSGITYKYRVGASKISIPEGSQFTGSTADVAPLSTAVSYRATASRCDIKKLLKRVVVLPLFPSDVTSRSAGVLTGSRMDAVFGASTGTSLRGYFLEISNGAWSPEFIRLPSQALPQAKAAYANMDLRAAATADFKAARNAAISANPSLALDGAGTQFVMIVMGSGVLGGEKGGNIIRLGSEDLASGQTLATSLSTPIHELGHATFGHSTYMTCTSAAGARFGVHPTLGLRDGTCVRSGSGYSDRSDPMGATARHYSGYSKYVIGFIGTVIQHRALADGGNGNNLHEYRLYTSAMTGSVTQNPVPGEPSRMATQLIKFTNDRGVAGKKGVAGGDYWIEFKDERGFNDPSVTGQDTTIGAGVVVQYRPAWPLSQMGPSIQTLVASHTHPAIPEGTKWLLDETSELEIDVTNVEPTYADITMRWK